VAPQPQEVMEVINKVASEHNCRLICAIQSTYHPTKEGYVVSSGGFCYKLGLEGEVQLENSAIALSVIEVLKEEGIKIPDECVINGMFNVKWPGRNEWRVHPKCGPILIDGAHNDGSSTQLRKYVNSVLKQKQLQHVLWIFGATKGKDLRKVLTNLLNEGDIIFAVPFLTPEQMGWIKCCELDDILNTSSEIVPNAKKEKYEDLNTALNRASEFKTTYLIVVTGSLYLVREVIIKVHL